jgi:hypothetical protein
MNLTGGGPNPMNRRDLVGVAVMLPTTKVLLGVLLLVAFVAAPSRTSELANLSLRAMVKETTKGYARIYGDRLCPIGSHVPEETPTTRVARTDRRTPTACVTLNLPAMSVGRTLTASETTAAIARAKTSRHDPHIRV